METKEGISREELLANTVKMHQLKKWNRWFYELVHDYFVELDELNDQTIGICRRRELQLSHAKRENAIRRELMRIDACIAHRVDLANTKIFSENVEQLKLNL